ncbi:MAG: hypothetical protein RI981_29 [Bacteroidota bacterium]|jgi:hypothetical protein
MQTFAYASVFVCLTFVAIAQGKNYKNQINRTLTEKVFLVKPVEEKEQQPSNQTPKYQQNKPNVTWADTFKIKTKMPSNKQHEGRPN